MPERPRRRSTISRRDLLRVGAIGGSALTLPRLLQAESQSGRSGRSCILIILSGGPGQHETFDPKPEAPQEIRGLYAPIATRTPGVQLTEMLPGLAQRSDRYCLIRSMSHGDVVHVSAVHTMLTAQTDGSPANDSPFVGSLVSKFSPSPADVPSYVWLHNMKTGTNKVPRYESGLGEIGFQHAPLRIGYELDNPSRPDFRVNEFDPREGLTVDLLRNRRNLLDQLEQSASLATVNPEYDRYREKAWNLLTGPGARHACDLNREEQTTRDRYGRHPLGQYCLMARRLVEAGVRLVTVTAWPGLAPGETKPTVTQVWDTHDNLYKEGDSMFGSGPFGMKWSLPRLDQALSALFDDLHERGLLEDTFVAVVGEFGRTPKFEGKGRGRGHWPNCYSALVAGAGVEGGTVYGESDRQGAYVASGRPVSQVDFGATLFHALGIDPHQRYGRDGFSARVNDGEPLLDIFG
ncbi:hypothetical protein Mal4_17240 [Maioricimonas rarisocia]|uniref:DUF1501 domain-containing protein n=1 Tax=Maioricimonas rarisocia TaxID=2528026 RepID=A0A517Z4K1_9PLAN|nr:DUF1501 domain-containing protein [Maioricimonas rarisocia]QDU37412.1 hypothetical protein Mal4_17240 [Maioricimonas rarisocia]